MTREDVVQAALTVERWCAEHEGGKYEDCDCPFAYITDDMAQLCMLGRRKPKTWRLAEHLRTRGLKHGEV
jgi:hypothetical protein